MVKTANYRKKIFDILEQVEVIDDKGRDVRSRMRYLVFYVVVRATR